jgi:hypothetical protein
MDWMKSIPGKYTVQSPLMMKSPSGLYVNILKQRVNYPVMHLNVDVKNYKLKAQLVPNAIMIKPIYKRRVSLGEQLW